MGNAHWRWERRLAEQGYRAIAGLDEAGRGSLAGPLVAAAVVLPPPTPSLLRRLRGVRDSKQLTEPERERLFARIRSVALSVGLGMVSAESIDLLGLTAAGQLALERAVRGLATQPDYLLIDAFKLPRLDYPQEGIIFGDAICVSIAAASIIAKVERDRLLNRLARRYPAFGFERNKGYSTPDHYRALAKLGPTPQHRFSYAPVRAVLGGDAVLTRKALGARGEALAAVYLTRQGYRVLSRNHRTQLGELDLVAQDGPEVVFVEVKTRLDGHDPMPEESVNAQKVGRLARLAEAYLAAQGQENVMWRIDVVAVVLDSGGELNRLEHLRNAVY